MKFEKPVALVLFALAASLGHAALEFSAYTKVGGESKFVVTDSDAKKSSDWLSLGKEFGGYTLLAFDEKKETLSVRKGDSTIELPLKVSKVKSAAASQPDVAVQLAAARAELAELRKRYLEKHPTVVGVLRKISDLEAQQAK